MVKGETKSGFKFELDDEAMDDMDFLELIVKADEGDISAFINLAKTALGEKQYQALKEHLRDKKGRTSPGAFKDALEEIFDAAGEEPKNSEPSPE